MEGYHPAGLFEHVAKMVRMPDTARVEPEPLQLGPPPVRLRSEINPLREMAGLPPLTTVQVNSDQISSQIYSGMIQVAPVDILRKEEVVVQSAAHDKENTLTEEQSTISRDDVSLAEERKRRHSHKPKRKSRDHSRRESESQISSVTESKGKYSEEEKERKRREKHERKKRERKEKRKEREKEKESIKSSSDEEINSESKEKRKKKTKDSERDSDATLTNENVDKLKHEHSREKSTSSSHKSKRSTEKESHEKRISEAERKKKKEKYKSDDENNNNAIESKHETSSSKSSKKDRHSDRKTESDKRSDKRSRDKKNRDDREEERSSRRSDKDRKKKSSLRRTSSAGSVANVKSGRNMRALSQPSTSSVSGSSRRRKQELLRNLEAQRVEVSKSEEFKMVAQMLINDVYLRKDKRVQKLIDEAYPQHSSPKGSRRRRSRGDTRGDARGDARDDASLPPLSPGSYQESNHSIYTEPIRGSKKHHPEDPDDRPTSALNVLYSEGSLKGYSPRSAVHSYVPHGRVSYPARYPTSLHAWQVSDAVASSYEKERLLEAVRQELRYTKT